MNNDSEWETVYNQYHRGSVEHPISPITIYPELNRHVIEILVFADSIRKTWRSAGTIYCFLQDPNIYSYPRATVIENVPVNITKIFKFPKDTEYYWLQYKPHDWFLWQTVTIKTWTYG